MKYRWVLLGVLPEVPPWKRPVLPGFDRCIVVALLGPVDPQEGRERAVKDGFPLQRGCGDGDKNKCSEREEGSENHVYWRYVGRQPRVSAMEGGGARVPTRIKGEEAGE